MAVSFLDFLKNNDITDFESRIKCKIKEDDPKSWIANTLLWKEQPEGVEFWVNLNKKWKEICDKNKVIYKKEFPKND